MERLTREKVEQIKKEMQEILEGEGDFMSNFEKALAKTIKENQ